MLAIGRVTAIDDVMIATFGAVVGWVLSKLWRYLGIDPVGDVMPHYSANRGDAQVR